MKTYRLITTNPLKLVTKNVSGKPAIMQVKDGYPVLGVIYVPATSTFYVGDNNSAYKEDETGKVELKVNDKNNNRIAVRSASHASPEEDTLLKKYEVTDSISVGSSLKFCMVAEGKADIYYRHGPTMEWDTGAGQAILESAGGKVFKGNEPKERFNYNKENLLNGSFLCLGF